MSSSKKAAKTYGQPGFPGWYQALASKDSRFDGRFFVGVSSTGIYCRPVCRARLPKPENCHYYATATAAEQDGFRPCLLCRPERAPGSALVDATSKLAYHAAKLMEAECNSGQSLEDFAGKMGYSPRHLRRAFQTEYGVSPVKYLQTCRLLLAKNLLADTSLPIIEVAEASGFGSLRRFNESFQENYRLVPTAMRGKNSVETTQTITLNLGYRPPFLWQPLLEFVRTRAIPGIEKVDAESYQRCLRFVSRTGKTLTGTIRVTNDSQASALIVEVNRSLMPVLPQVLFSVRQFFDLYSVPEVVEAGLESMNEFRPGLFVPGVRLPGAFDPFEVSVRAILGQQITVKAAATLAARLTNEYGEHVETTVDGLDRIFPRPETLLELSGNLADHLGPLGVIRSRSDTIREIARGIVDGELQLSHNPDPAGQVAALQKIKGIGPWTAKYVVMRTLSWTDAFLETDYGIKKALEPLDVKQIVEVSKGWAPWRSYATVSLWNSLS